MSALRSASKSNQLFLGPKFHENMSINFWVNTHSNKQPEAKKHDLLIMFLQTGNFIVFLLPQLEQKWINVTPQQHQCISSFPSFLCPAVNVCDHLIFPPTPTLSKCDSFFLTYYSSYLSRISGSLLNKENYIPFPVQLMPIYRSPRQFSILLDTMYSFQKLSDSY